MYLEWFSFWIWIMESLDRTLQARFCSVCSVVISSVYHVLWKFFSFWIKNFKGYHLLLLSKGIWFPLEKNYAEETRAGDSSMVKSTCCSFKRPSLSFQHSCISSQLSVTPILGYPASLPASASTRHTSLHRHTCKQIFRHSCDIHICI